MPWESIQFVTGGFTAIAFLIAAILAALRMHLNRKRDLIRSAPEEERTQLVTEALESFSIDTTNLTRVQKFELLQKRMDLRSRRYRDTLIGGIVVVLILAGITVYAISEAQPGPLPLPPKPPTISQVEVEAFEASLAKLDPAGKGLPTKLQQTATDLYRRYKSGAKLPNEPLRIRLLSALGYSFLYGSGPNERLVDAIQLTLEGCRSRVSTESAVLCAAAAACIRHGMAFREAEGAGDHRVATTTALGGAGNRLVEAASVLVKVEPTCNKKNFGWYASQLRKEAAALFRAAARPGIEGDPWDKDLLLDAANSIALAYRGQPDHRWIRADLVSIVRLVEDQNVAVGDGISADATVVCQRSKGPKLSIGLRYECSGLMADRFWRATKALSQTELCNQSKSLVARCKGNLDESLAHDMKEVAVYRQYAPLQRLRFLACDVLETRVLDPQDVLRRRFSNATPRVVNMARAVLEEKKWLVAALRNCGKN